MYLATLVCPTSIPSLSSSPWTRGAPHNGLAMLISRINLRISADSAGRPAQRRDFHRQSDRNPARCHRWPHDCKRVESVWKNPAYPAQNQSVSHREWQPGYPTSSQHDDLLPERKDFSFQRRS
jgi:hypothetical protein